MFIIFLTLYHRLCIKVGRSHCEITDVLVAFWKLIVDLFLSQMSPYLDKNEPIWTHSNTIMVQCSWLIRPQTFTWQTEAQTFLLYHTQTLPHSKPLFMVIPLKMLQKTPTWSGGPVQWLLSPILTFTVSRRRGEQSHERAATVSYDHCMNCCFWPLDWKRGAEKDICKNSGFKCWFLSPLQAKTSIKLNSGTIT